MKKEKISQILFLGNLAIRMLKTRFIHGRLRKDNLWLKFLIYFGFKSQCCGADIDYPVGWEGRGYCTLCNKRLF